MSKYKYHNGGRTRTGTSSDCAVRALALATGKRYTAVYNWLRRDMLSWYGSQQGVDDDWANRLSKPGVGNRGVGSGHSEAFLREHGWRAERFTFEKGTTVADVANYFKNETVVVSCRRARQRTRGHMVCVRRGTVLDTWDCRELLVRRVWRKK